MAVNDTIRESDYNNIRNKIVNVIGTGAAESGWGQTLVSSAVATGNPVTINEWGKLRYDIINAYKHIYGTTPTTVQPAEGNTVRYSNTFVPNTTTDAPVTQYNTYVDTIVTNRFTVHSSQASTFSYPATSATWPGALGSYWTSKIQATVTASWPTAEAARKFFNAGGEIRFSSARTGGSSTSQCVAWTNLLTAAGTRAFGGNKPNASFGVMDGQNYFRLTSTHQVWSSNFSSSPYGTNNFRISARSPGVANNSLGTSASVEFLIEWIDAYTDPGNYPLDTPNTIDAVDGTFSLSVSYLYASGVLEPPGTGNFTVSQPTVTIGAITL